MFVEAGDQKFLFDAGRGAMQRPTQLKAIFDTGATAKATAVWKATRSCRLRRTCAGPEGGDGANRGLD